MKDVSIVLSGEAGQGIQTVEHVLTRILKNSGFHVFATKEYMSRVRGGNNTTEIRVSSERVRAFVDRIDILVPLGKGATERLKNRITEKTLIVGEEEFIKEEKGEKIAVPFLEIAKQIGNRIYANSVAIGFLSGLLGAEKSAIEEQITAQFREKGEEVVKDNIRAAMEGYRRGQEFSEKIGFDVEKDPSIKDEVLLNGAEAVGLGAIAGGCNFVSSYPMSPSTSVLVFLAQHKNDFGIVVEQAEDEIAAMNMIVGAWYAGVRGLVTTSGGGFALMEEALSLAGMVESPAVIHLAQRPGPATGLPTRTEQADLNLALYAGHGEFPRIIYAPGNIEEAFYLTQRAFNVADRYQVPVFILTDQYLVDSFYNLPGFDLKELKVEKHIVKTTRDYVRYAITEDGISPRGVPGYGEGLVRVDSDEHDEFGHITEDFDTRVRMVDKRLRKGKTLKKDIVRPKLIGDENYRVLLVAWGSTLEPIREAIEDMSGVALLHFSQVWPLDESAVEHMERAEKVVAIEGNATGQFANLIRQVTGFHIKDRILKYSGLQFTVEELKEKILEVM
ncbi:2-oxoacid:acceptor oxidoreductase subunit alpha [Thermotoga neapolitana]|jgi:2-oxoglutarate ferredoxin oxidoreductase subunit alpha|uniref:Pyruvate flavodoxin/ferredoxin oxidoreductase domain protein n=1 Tax=Thermotoga neapolitana (strain ATCC 49049 / DSM 4359 / NBRC 107923 / NS-E) TaxID=309803 RepID=B9K9F4_THENN|nr:2-oxoacid:acceptor oxidoreductase subunit alpha [Thermotoga neapolitana]MDK2786583.1 2-oxoglutarate/2-oxoacid ferredoxin oxidoreductase subunit alpha [Thermotoga sp.]ACM23587.1 Pyruvate flavodoxin/ferredoxin oxidoreductase domain protein [Thermotoga neapolitana DSM 4359]KFZ21214.1 Pyruvate flavodoxin/ferredoxin oxidoreductase domain protein [Thermotoga neapolitana LA10]MDK2950102.1 2-oxoglutarate/2-oxoacid ferredoxin oxidoreductase subunit alpha [Thermotoga sp.]HBF11335.1 2-oxoacid:acceptor